MLIQNLSGSGNIRADKKVIDMAPFIAWLEPDAFPLLSLTRRLAKKPATQGEFKALELLPQTVTTNTTAAATAGAATINLAAFTHLVVGHVLENTRTHEKLEVSATPTTAAVAVTRARGITPAAAMLTGDEILTIGDVNEEGAALKAIRTQQTDLFTNFLLETGGSKSQPYAGTPEYTELPKGENVQLRKISRKDYLGSL